MPDALLADETVMVTLWRVSDPESASPFDRHRDVGLHHLALAVPDVPALLELYERVAAHPGVTIELEPGPVAPGADARHFICRMPGDLRIGFIPRG